MPIFHSYTLYLTVTCSLQHNISCILMHACMVSFQRCSLVVIVSFIALGLALFTFDLTQFSMEGFILVLIASFLSGLRWTLAQKVMQKNEIGRHELTNILSRAKYSNLVNSLLRFWQYIYIPWYMYAFNTYKQVDPHRHSQVHTLRKSQTMIKVVVFSYFSTNAT